MGTRFAPTYEEVALALKGKVQVGKVNCEKYAKVCDKASVTGYPTLRFYRGQDKGELEDYFSENIREREQEKILLVVEQLIKRAEGDMDRKKGRRSKTGDENETGGDQENKQKEKKKNGNKHDEL